ncbi:MAG: WD40 repeat domain-containing protein [Treponema sp.]|nr:WD40 repeat domain-containing protein [Treponema sp.]
MKIRLYVSLLLFLIITFQAYSGGNSDKETTSSVENFNTPAVNLDLTADNLSITARGAIGRLEAVTSGPMWSGDGGKNIRLAVVAPEIQGDVPPYLPIYIQGLLNNNFGKYSAVNLIDRQNLNRIISEQNIAASGRFSDNDFIRIGNLANAQFFLFGTIQRLSGNRFSLQLSVTESSTGVRKATFMKEGTQTQLEGRAALINEATAELLSQLGVQLTEAGLCELLAGNISTVQAQTGLARGITAQVGGSEVEALLNFAQAVSFDPSQLEALSRLNTLTTTISGGTISQRITSDIQARDRWIEAFKETAQFFDKHPPFEIIFDPNLIQVGNTDYARRTVTLGMRIALDSSVAGFDALNALLDGLEKTGRRGTWGFSGWPLMEINPRTAGTVVFGGKRSFSYKVDVALINENGKRIGNGSVTLISEFSKFSSGDKNVSIPFSVDDVVRFQNIKTEDLTPTLTIVIVAVNGISSSNLAASGFLRVDTGDLEKKEHLESIHSVAFSPDGRYFLSGSRDSTVKLWDTFTGRLIRTFSTSGLQIPGYLSDGSEFLSGGAQGVNTVVFSPDGNYILSGSNDNLIRLWDVNTGRLIRIFSSHSSSVQSVAFSPDGNQFISAGSWGDNTIKLWDVKTGRLVRTFSGHTNEVKSVAFSPYGSQFLSCSFENIFRLWDVGTGRLIETFSGHTKEVNSVAFSFDGRPIISGSSDNTIRLWNVKINRTIKIFSGHTNNINSVEFSPDDSKIVSCSNDGTIKLWDVGTGRLIRTFSGDSIVYSVAFSPDGKLIISGFEDSTIKIWDAITGKLIWLIGTSREFLYGGG